MKKTYHFVRSRLNNIFHWYGHRPITLKSLFSSMLLDNMGVLYLFFFLFYVILLIHNYITTFISSVNPKINKNWRQDESQTTTDEWRITHRQLQTNPPESFFEYSYKTLFSESIQHSRCSNEKGGLSLKEGSPVFDVYSSERISSWQ